MNCLVADIGGTNARFALLRSAGGALEDIRVYHGRDYPTVESAMDAYLEEVAVPRLDGLAIAVAGPVQAGVCRFTNSAWEVSAARLGERYATARVSLVNDFAAVAWGLPELAAGAMLIGVERRPVLGDTYSLGVIGPGTGLGMAGLVRRDGCTVPIISEGGHAGFAPETELQREVLAVLSQTLERVSVERVVSGRGIVNLHRGLASVTGLPLEADAPEGIFARSVTDAESLSAQTTALFFEILGQVAGDLALTLGATDGVFIAGGVAQRYPELLQGGGFRQAFERKGRHTELLASVPTLLIRDPYPGLVGAAQLLKR